MRGGEMGGWGKKLLQKEVEAQNGLRSHHLRWLEEMIYFNVRLQEDFKFTSLPQKAFALRHFSRTCTYSVPSYCENLDWNKLKQRLFQGVNYVTLADEDGNSMLANIIMMILLEVRPAMLSDYNM